MPKRNRKFKNPFHKPKKVKIDTTIVNPSDEDEVEIEETIFVKSEDEANVNPPLESPT